MHTIMEFVQSTISLEFCINLNIVSLKLNQFTNGFMKTFIRKKTSPDNLAICTIDFRHDLCKLEILGKVERCQNIHHQYFDPTLRITKSCCRAVLDDRLDLQNEPPFTNIGF